MFAEEDERDLLYDDTSNVEEVHRVRLFILENSKNADNYRINFVRDNGAKLRAHYFYVFKLANPVIHFVGYLLKKKNRFIRI